MARKNKVQTLNKILNWCQPRTPVYIYGSDYKKQYSRFGNNMLTKISRGKKRLFTISVPSSTDHLFEREGCLVCISCQTTPSLRINLNDNIQYFELRVETKQIYSTNLPRNLFEGFLKVLSPKKCYWSSFKAERFRGLFLDCF